MSADEVMTSNHCGINHGDKKMRPVQVYDFVMAPTPESAGPFIRRPIYQGTFLEFGIEGGDSGALVENSSGFIEWQPFHSIRFLDTAETVKAKPKNGDVPYRDIIACYHEVLPALARVRVLTAHRKQQMQRRWNNELPDLDAWRSYFEDVARSKFLMGKNHGGWKADIDWLLKPGSLARVSEGKYHA